MKSRSHILIKTGCMIIMLFLTGILHGQVDPGAKTAPAEVFQNNQEKKKEDEAGRIAKEVKSSSPDMKKARKGARPPNISRPAGSVRPQGAGKPAGAGKSGRR